jgi:hypothetical protein
MTTLAEEAQRRQDFRTFPTANQWVAHISPAFGEMWETRTSTSTANPALKFR